ncbi:MAG: hypothetical protein U0984_06785, partial [Prosthecobacter sp.]|nr:hypothetical protein [Prosthecobacter sp.]
MGYFDSYDNKTQLWINGVVVEEPGFIFRYFNALPQPLSTECPVPPDWDDQLQDWRHQLAYGDSGRSDLSPAFLAFLTRLKVAVFESAQQTVRWTQQRSDEMHEVLPQPPFDIGVGYVRKAAAILDTMIKAVSQSELP